HASARGEPLSPLAGFDGTAETPDHPPSAASPRASTDLPRVTRPLPARATSDSLSRARGPASPLDENRAAERMLAARRAGIDARLAPRLAPPGDSASPLLQPSPPEEALSLPPAEGAREARSSLPRDPHPSSQLAPDSAARSP